MNGGPVVTNELAALLAPAAEAGWRVRIGTVATVSPFTVTVARAATAVPCVRLASYAPVVGDRVAVVESPGNTPLVLGKVV